MTEYLSGHMHVGLSQGIIGLTPGRDESSAEWNAYTTLWGQQPATLVGGTCSANQDASGNFIHRRGDVDNDPTTPDACAGISTYDPSNPGSYAKAVGGKAME